MSRFKSLNGYEVKDEYARAVAESNLNSIGNLSNLETTAKTNLVNAINEVNSKESGSATDINNLSTYAHNVRQVDIGLPDGETFADHCFWDGETFIAPIHNIMGVLNTLWWIYDIGSLQISNSMSYMYNTTIEQPDFYFANGTIGGNEIIENRFDLSSKNVERTIVKTNHTFTGTSDELYVPIFKVQEHTDVPTGTDPYKVVIDDVYSINLTGEVTDLNDNNNISVYDGLYLFHQTNTCLYLDDNPTSPTYNWYVIQLIPKNSSLVIGNPTKLIAKVEYSTKKETIVNP